ncbi:MAG: ABC transporter permease [Bacteroidota bacterium]
MIADILRFEIKKRFTHWSILLLYALLIFQGVWYTIGEYGRNVNEGLLMNAPSLFYKNLAAGGLLMMIIVAVITGPVLYREIRHQTGQWLFTQPIAEKAFLLSRFLAAYLINALVALGYVLGMALLPYFGVGEAHRFGAIPWGQLLHGYFFILLPNLLLLTSLVFVALVYTRKITASYLAVIITVILFLLMYGAAGTGSISPVLQLADPFSYIAVDHTIDLMPVELRNTGYLPFSGYLLYNRLLWLAISAGLIFLTYRKFSFQSFLQPKGKKGKGENLDATATQTVRLASSPPKVKRSFRSIDFIKKLWSLSVLELKNVVRIPSFKVIIALVIIMNLMQNLLWNASVYLGPTHALTTVMTNFRMTFGVFVIILLMVWAGELFFKDRSAKFWQIADALPIPVWTVALSRFIAISLVALMIVLTFMLTGIVVQVMKGETALIDFSLYAYDLLGYNWGWLTYVLQIALVFFIAGLTRNRILTHIIACGIFILTIMAFDLGLMEQAIYGYAVVPGMEDWSEINGYGMWISAAGWYFGMWALLALAFVLAGIWMWQRGSQKKWSSVFSVKNRQLAWGGKLALVLALLGFAFVRMHITEEVNGKGNFTASDQEDLERAAYEKQYAHLKNIFQPQYQHLDLILDFYPNERSANYRASIQLQNDTITGTDTLYLNWPEFTTVEELKLQDQRLVASWNDEEHNITAYAIPFSHQKEALLELTLTARKTYDGYTQGGQNAQADLLFNGSFGSLKDFLFTIGYDEGKELTENRIREDYGLPKLSSRMASIEEEKAFRQDRLAPDAVWGSGSLLLSTTLPQKMIAPGTLVNNWTEGGRRFTQYEMADPRSFNWFVGSAHYEKEVANTQGTSLDIYYDAKHAFNIDVYKKAGQQSIAFIRDNLGGRLPDELRLYEIPYYQHSFYSFPNAMAISEKEGWYALSDALPEKAYLYQSLAAQLIKQWLYGEMRIANVQGADMLAVALPEALALLFLKQELGEESTEIILQKKQENYAKQTNNAANQEPPLLFADGTDYLEINKGAIALYRAIADVGQKRFTQILHAFLQDKKGNPCDFRSFYNRLRPHLSKETSRLFENA